ncbi:MAG: AP-4-A phosphorylase [Betaproteobacteria bacterium ADurb.Bin341]|nr:MAG: AP-4-A phosphorylase [Betaproteobacteria bacterium ADurb.Bin341]
MNTALPDCELCTAPGGVMLWQSALCRVVRVEHPDYPGYCRVIWNQHVREMTDLSADERATLMEIVFAVESVVRALFSPDKINLASLGNMTPHVHWHIIPRWETDTHFPEPIWGKAQRAGNAARPTISDRQLADRLGQALATLGGNPIEH